MKKLCFIVLTLVLTACTNRTPSLQPALWSFDGKLALRSPNKNQSASINWQQFNGSYGIVLRGSLGLGTQKIDGNKNQIIIDDGKQQRILSATQSTALLPGLNIPLGALANNAEELIRNCPLNSSKPLLDGSQWIIHCEKHKNFAGLMRPSKIRISDGETTLILLIKQWN